MYVQASRQRGGGASMLPGTPLPSQLFRHAIASTSQLLTHRRARCTQKYPADFYIALRTVSALATNSKINCHCTCILVAWSQKFCVRAPLHCSTLWKPLKKFLPMPLPLVILLTLVLDSACHACVATVTEGVGV